MNVRELRRRVASAAGSRTDPGRSFVALLSGDLAAKGLRLLATIVLARTLTLDEFGLLNIAIAASGIAVVLASLGLNDLGPRDVAIAARPLATTVGTIVTTRLLAFGTLSAIAVTVVAIADPSRLSLVVAACAMGVFMVGSADWVLRGLERMPALGVAWIIGGVTVLVGAIVVGATADDATAALTAFVAAELAMAAACWIAACRVVRPSLGLRGASGLLRRSWPLALSAVIVYSYYANIDTIILGATRSAEDAGLYSAPYRTFLVFNVVAVFAAYALLPSLSRRAAAGTVPVAGGPLVDALSALAAYGVAVVGLAELAGADLLSFLFGAEFASMEETFVLLTVGVAWYSVGYPAGYSLIADDRNKLFLAGAGAAGVTNLALNLVLIPPFGPIGAGVATAVAFGVASCVWLVARGLAVVAARVLVPALGVATIGAVAALVADDERALIGVGTVALAVLMLAVSLGHRRRRSAD